MPVSWKGTALETDSDVCSTTAIVLASEVQLQNLGSVQLVFSTLFHDQSRAAPAPAVAAGQSCITKL